MDWLFARFPVPLDPLILLSIISKSVTLRLEEGRPPSQTPVTVVTPAILMKLAVTSVTLPKDTSFKVGSEYWTRFPVVTMPKKSTPGLVTVEIPLASPEIDAIPKQKLL